LEVAQNSPEAWRQVNAHILVSLFETAVLADEVQIVTTDDDGSLHFHLAHDAGQDSATDGAHAGEGAFLVDVVT
jgi:hypothetical protein